MDSVRCIVASAALREWKLHQFDAVTAFSHGDVDSSIYMKLPEGFEEPGYVSRLRRSLYGLKQVPRIWSQCVHRVLSAHGFTCQGYTGSIQDGWRSDLRGTHIVYMGSPERE
jgi:hypothetical protein